MLQPNSPSLEDLEDPHVPPDLPAIIDTHVHIFPHSVFSAVWRWFDTHGWRIRYQLRSFAVIDFLLSRGVDHVVALQYAHKPGIARELNKYMAEQCRAFGQRVTGMATVYPGEKDGGRILEEAFAAGLGGVKLHAHVQCFDMNSPEMEGVYACCRAHNKPLIMHVGREPKSPAYRCDPHTLCSVEKLERVVQGYPDLKVCVPHLGLGEIPAYQKLIEKYDNLWLDTAMAISDYFPTAGEIDLGRYRADRIMYGSDFPNIPYAWDRELKVLRRVSISQNTLEKILFHNAVDFFSLQIPCGKEAGRNAG
jgi:uncharacterized protein